MRWGVSPNQRPLTWHSLVLAGVSQEACGAGAMSRAVLHSSGLAEFMQEAHSGMGARCQGRLCSSRLVGVEQEVCLGVDARSKGGTAFLRALGGHTGISRWHGCKFQGWRIFLRASRVRVGSAQAQDPRVALCSFLNIVLMCFL